MSATQPEKIGESRAYWTHDVQAFPSPVAQFRMAQLIDLDDRLYENARIVYRFLVGWYHDGHGDALLSMRHVSKVMRARAPEGSTVLSHSVVQRAIIALMESGWVVRTFRGRGKGKGASRYVPVLNVLELAAQGKFPEPSHSSGTVDGESELSHTSGTVVSHCSGTVEAEPSHSSGTKTLLRDTPTGAVTGNSTTVSAPPASAGLTAAAPDAGFEKIWKAYLKLGSKTAAREAFEAIDNPDVDHIADRAAAWAASARPGQKRMPLEKWLVAEKYDEADRRVERKEKVENPEITLEADNDHLAEWAGEVSPFLVPGRYQFKIVDAVIKDYVGKWDTKVGAQQALHLTLDTLRSPGTMIMSGIPFKAWLRADDFNAQARGLHHVGRLGGPFDDATDLVGLTVGATIRDAGEIEFDRVEQGEAAA